MYHYFLDQPGMELYDIMCILDFDDDSYQYLNNNQIYIKYLHKGHLKFGIKVYYSEGNGPEEL